MALLLASQYIPASIVNWSPQSLVENRKSVGIIASIVYGVHKGWKITRKLSLSGDSKNPLIKFLHNILRKYLNHGYMIKGEFYPRLPWRILTLVNGNDIIVNYGSYGTVPREVLEHQIGLERLCEVAPDNFFRQLLPVKYEESRNIVAEHIGCNPQNLVFVENITFGMNCILRSMLPALSDDDDAILHINLAYPAVVKAVKVLAERCKVKVIQMDLTFPIASEDEVLKIFEETFKEHTNIKIAIFDHICSASAVKLPVRDIGHICKKYNVISIVDGAHAPGQVVLDIENLGVDIYIGNLHKWYYTPKSCGILYVNPKYHDIVQPTVVSHGCHGNFHWRFSKQATKNYTAQLTAGYAVRYMERLGGIEHLHEYITPLVEWAVQLYKTDWGTQELSIPDSMKAPYMRIVLLPEIFTKYYGSKSEDADRAIIDMLNEYKLSIFINPVQGRLATRVSAQIFSGKSEYRYASKCILEKAQKLKEQMQ